MLPTCPSLPFFATKYVWCLEATDAAARPVDRVPVVVVAFATTRAAVMTSVIMMTLATNDGARFIIALPPRDGVASHLGRALKDLLELPAEDMEVVTLLHEGAAASTHRLSFRP